MSSCHIVKPAEDSSFRTDDVVVGGGGRGGDDVGLLLLLSSVVTIVIVTSPVASNPSTEMIDRCLAGVFRSFPQLGGCRVMIACDGVREVLVDPIASSSSPSSTTAAPNGRSDCGGAPTRRIYGKCTQGQWDRYEEYCQRLSGRKFLEVIRHHEWKGFAMVLQSALEKVKTPLVMVLPHDYELMPSTLRDVHLPTLLLEMMVPNSDDHSRSDKDNNSSSSNRIAYIGLPNPRSAKFGSRHAEALKGIPSRRILRTTVAGVVPGDEDDITPYVLEPLAMWKENPHFATLEAYRSIVFSKEGRKYKRGQFIEDTLGQEMLADIKQRGAGAFRNMYLLALPRPCSFHMDGPRYLPIEERLARNYVVQEFDIQAATRAKAYVAKKEEEF